MEVFGSCRHGGYKLCDCAATQWALAYMDERCVADTSYGS